jgi:hypothetical protein
MTTPRMTSALLRQRGACPEQVAIFERVFPDGAPLTLTAYRRAQQAGNLLRTKEVVSCVGF